MTTAEGTPIKKRVESRVTQKYLELMCDHDNLRLGLLKAHKELDELRANPLIPDAEVGRVWRNVIDIEEQVAAACVAMDQIRSEGGMLYLCK